MNSVSDLMPLYVYVFVGAGFPMHCDLIWSIVSPLLIFKQPPCAHTGPARQFHLPENSGTNPSGGDMVNFLDGYYPNQFGAAVPFGNMGFFNEQ
jgi:hypothetical protein